MAETQEQPPTQRPQATQAAETTQTQAVEEVTPDHPGPTSRGERATDQARPAAAPRSSAAAGEAAAAASAASVDTAGPAPANPVAAGGTGPDLTLLRDAIRHARNTGWDHFTVGPDYDRAHVWRHGGRRVELYDGELNIERPQTRPCSWAPASLAEAVAVLEVASLLPPAWSRT